MQKFIARRANLATQLQANSVAILPGAGICLRNSDTAYPFRQNSDFFYLTGLCEADAVMVLTKDADGNTSFILFNLPKDPEKEVWDGRRIGQLGAKKDYHADFAYDIAEIDKEIPKLLANKRVVYYPFNNNDIAEKIFSWLKKVKRESKSSNLLNNMLDLSPLIHEARLFKSADEIDLMRKAAQISAQAHIQLMQAAKPGMYEYQLEAIFNGYCLDQGCRSLAYGTIVAGGNNACTLHYVENESVLKDGELVLVDAGGEYNYYAADITRTFPINGKFTSEQKQIYAIVLAAQLAGIQQAKPGKTFFDVEQAVLEVIVAGLVELGILQGKVEDLIRDRAYAKFYMHSCGHWLGLDVHDVGMYKIDGEFRKFAPGMVLTVEPGIYINANNKNIDKKWLGIGIRIEDDVLITASGNEVLSKDAPKEIAELESVRI